MRRIFALGGLLLLSMGRGTRARADRQQAQRACEAVRSGLMSIQRAAESYGVNKDALHRNLKGTVPVDTVVGPAGFNPVFRGQISTRFGRTAVSVHLHRARTME